MNPLLEHLIIMYLLISLIWFIISAIIAVTYKTSLIWLFIFFLMTFLYIPVAVYFASIGEIDRVRQGVDFTIIATLVYLVVELVLAVVFIVNLP